MSTRIPYSHIIFALTFIIAALVFGTVLVGLHSGDAVAATGTPTAETAVVATSDAVNAA